MDFLLFKVMDDESTTGKVVNAAANVAAVGAAAYGIYKAVEYFTAEDTVSSPSNGGEAAEGLLGVFLKD